MYLMNRHVYWVPFYKPGTVSNRRLQVGKRLGDYSIVLLIKVSMSG